MRKGRVWQESLTSYGLQKEENRARFDEGASHLRIGFFLTSIPKDRNTTCSPVPTHAILIG